MNRKYGRKAFINTDALKKYRNENNLNNMTLAEKLGETQKNVANWISRRRVPKEILERLEIRTRNVQIIKESAAPPSQRFNLCLLCRC